MTMGSACTTDISDTRDTIHYKEYTADSSQRGRAKWKVGRRSMDARNATPSSRPQQRRHNPLTATGSAVTARKNTRTPKGAHKGTNEKSRSASLLHGPAVCLMGRPERQPAEIHNTNQLFSGAEERSTFSSSELAVVAPAIGSDAFE